MTIRRGVQSDVAHIAALEREIFGPDAWSEAQVSGELEAPTHLVVVAERDGALVGYGCVSVAGDVADLLRIAVVPTVRRTGLASRILTALHEQSSPAERMLLEVASSNVAALAFYAAHGYTEIARRAGYYANGDGAVVMEHALG